MKEKVPFKNAVRSVRQIPLQMEYQRQLQLMNVINEYQRQLQLMNVALSNRCLPMDYHRYPRLPYNTPFYFQVPYFDHFASVEFYEKLDIKTLFFVFYYMANTLSQYLASKALKKKSWRFYTKYNMWCTRMEDVIITETYEQGTFIFFDYQIWDLRRIPNFFCELQYIESRI